MVLFQSTILSPWLVLPLAGVALVVIALHVLAQQRPDVPDKRRRIRTASGLLMMIVTGLLAYALGIDPSDVRPATRPEHAQSFLLIWLTIIGLVGIIVVLAALDALHTAALAVSERRRLQESILQRAHTDAASRTSEPPRA